jgi:hypothetical protein
MGWNKFHPQLWASKITEPIYSKLTQFQTIPMCTMALDRAAPVDLSKEVFVAEEGKKFYLSDTSDVPTDVETAFQSGDFNGPHVFVIFYTKPFIFWYILKHILKPIRFLHKTVICAYSARLNHPIYVFGPRIVFPQPRAKMVSLGPRFSRFFSMLRHRKMCDEMANLLARSCKLFKATYIICTSNFPRSLVPRLPICMDLLQPLRYLASSGLRGRWKFLFQQTLRYCASFLKAH